MLKQKTITKKQVIIKCQMVKMDRTVQYGEGVKFLSMPLIDD